MLFHDKTRFDGSHHMPTAQNHGIQEAGQCLVQVPDNAGGAALAASKGVAGEVFAGVSLMDVSVPTRVAKTRVVTVGTDAQTFSLGAFTAGSARITDKTNTANTTAVTIANDGTVTVLAAGAAGAGAEGDVFTILYAAPPSLAEVQTLVGDFDRISAIDAGAEVGAMLQGQAHTSNFDTTAAWAINDVPKTGPNGSFAKTGDGTACTGVRVVSLPRAGQPYLGLEVHIR